jgi:hypothetical protein
VQAQRNEATTSVPTSSINATAQMVAMLSGKSKTKVLAPMRVHQKG